jgi:dTDP-4-dehydrorhamnose reductase
LFGWNSQAKLGLAEWMLQRLSAGEVLQAFHDVIFNPLLANDLSRVLISMMNRSLHGLYHVASPSACSKYEFALHLAKTFGADCRLVQPVSVDTFPFRAKRPKNTSLSIDQLQADLGHSLPTTMSGIVALRELRDGGFVARLKALKGQ